MRILEKTKKLPQPTLVCLRQLGDPPSNPRIVTTAYYYSFFDFTSDTKLRFVAPQKSTK